METAPLTPELRTLAPIVAGRLGTILTTLLAVIANGFPRVSRLAPLILPIHHRLWAAIRRFTALMANLAAGRLPRQRPSRPGRGHPPKSPLPTTTGWFLLVLPETVRHEAALCRAHLERLLAEPGVADLLAASPTAQRLLNPIRRALALPPVDAPRQPPPPRGEPTVKEKPPPAADGTQATGWRHPLYPTLQAFRPFPPRVVLKPT